MIAWNTKRRFGDGVCVAPFVIGGCQWRHISLCLSWRVRLLWHSHGSQLCRKKEQNPGAPGRDSWEQCAVSENAPALGPMLWIHVKKKKRRHLGGSGQVGAFSCRARTSLSLEKQISVQLAKWYRDTASGRRNNSAECGFYSRAPRSASFLHL